MFCGLGRKGRQLVRDFHEHGDPVGVIERDEGNDGIGSCREDGIIVLLTQCDRRIAAAAKLALDRAKYLIAICGDDGANVEIAVQAHQLLQAQAVSALRQLSLPDRQRSVGFEIATLPGTQASKQ